jgi:hypothetical protein
MVEGSGSAVGRKVRRHTRTVSSSISTSGFLRGKIEALSGDPSGEKAVTWMEAARQKAMRASFRW